MRERPDDLAFGSLVETIRERGEDLGVVGILLCGSLARGDWDEASDIDILAAVEGRGPWIQVGEWAGRDIEILYQPLDALRRHRPKRATFEGARILYDPLQQLAPILERWEKEFRAPRPASAGDAAYSRWELAHGIRMFRSPSVASDPGAWIYLRNEWVSTLMDHLFGVAEVWAPTRRRQFACLEGLYPGLTPELKALLRADSAEEVAGRARALLDRWAPDVVAISPLNEAPLHPLE